MVWLCREYIKPVVNAKRLMDYRIMVSMGIDTRPFGQ